MAIHDKIIIKQDGEDRTILMSFGLLSELTKLAPSVESVALFAVDPDTTRTLRCALLAERKNGGKVVNPISDPDELDVSVEDTENLIKWAVDHVLGFFVRQMKMISTATKAVEGQLDLPVVDPTAPPSLHGGSKA